MQSKKFRVTMAAAACMFAILGGLLAVVEVRASSVDVDAASNRLRSTLQKVEQGSNPNIGNERKQPEVPDLQGIRHQVPDIRDYGHQKKVDVDPMNIAKRYSSARQPDLAAADKGDLLVFVSFSMPEASLRRIAHETARAGGAMVIRGFKDSSMKATIQAAQEIAALQGDLLIHPDLFDHYNITEVPTTVLARSGDEGLDSCSGNADEGMCTEHLQVRGDVSLHAALDYFINNKADEKLIKIAEAKLAKLGGAK